MISLLTIHQRGKVFFALFFDPRYSQAIMKSHVWPGAFAVAYNLQTDYMYIGWGQKHDYNMLHNIFMDEIKMENPTQDDTFTVEFQEFTKKEKMENEKHRIRKKRNSPFPLRFNRTKYKGGENVITYY
ncbi:unnamed protein product [Macrosiphum euphorbiae]|uniref:Uncharacterized protein n=1 Tax=Macrosiphum euphorbiae TaxID=13131 RepID=A0AAV0Y6J9_9HEMI|nr:unnamed protein product [Macrosiphum euphorbiae]